MNAHALLTFSGFPPAPPARAHLPYSPFPPLFRPRRSALSVPVSVPVTVPIPIFPFSPFVPFTSACTP